MAIDGFDELGLPPLGHNRPPADDPAAKALKRAQDLVANANRWATERPVIEDSEQAGACQLSITQLRAVDEDLKAARKAEQDAFTALMWAKYRDPIALVELALGRLLKIAGDWLAKERLRLELETIARERAAADAAAKANEAITRAVTDRTMQAELDAQRATETAVALAEAAGKPVDRAGIKGDFAPRKMTLKTFWHATVIDDAAALEHYAKHPAVRAAALDKIKQLAGEHARKAKRADAAPPGCRFYSTEKAM